MVFSRLLKLATFGQFVGTSPQTGVPIRGGTDHSWPVSFLAEKDKIRVATIGYVTFKTLKTKTKPSEHWITRIFFEKSSCPLGLLHK